MACIPATKVEDTTSGKSSKEAPYLWQDKAFPKLVKISADFSANEITGINDMSTAWKTALENKVTFFNHSGGTTTEKTNALSDLDDLYDSEMAIYKTINWPLSLPGSALAVTQIFGRRYNVGKSNEFVDIEHADILVNYDDYDFYTTAKDPNKSEFDLRTVLLHELGHFLGLQHRTSSNSVMISSVSHLTINRAPKSLDKTDMADKYDIAITGGAPALLGEGRETYSKKVAGESIKILIELHASGECIHKIDGAVVERHPAHLKE